MKKTYRNTKGSEFYIYLTFLLLFITSLLGIITLFNAPISATDAMGMASQPGSFTHVYSGFYFAVINYKGTIVQNFGSNSSAIAFAVLFVITTVMAIAAFWNYRNGSLFVYWDPKPITTYLVLAVIINFIILIIGFTASPNVAADSSLAANGWLNDKGPKAQSITAFNIFYNYTYTPNTDVLGNLASYSFRDSMAPSSSYAIMIVFAIIFMLLEATSVIWFARLNILNIEY